VPADDVAALYARPLADFVAARADLAKALRAAGERDRAAEVAHLRRPTVPAWALDQVARTAPELIDGLLQAGSRLREATDRAVRGDASSLRSAETEERAAVSAVVARAAAEGAAAGVPLNDAHRLRVAATLRAAVLDDDVAAALRAGTLDRDHEASPLGFGTGPAPSPRPARPRPERTSAGARAQRAELDRLRKEAERTARRAARLHGEAEDATRRAAELRAQSKDAALAAREAQRQLTAAERANERRRHGDR